MRDHGERALFGQYMSLYICGLPSSFASFRLTLITYRCNLLTLTFVGKFLVVVGIAIQVWYRNVDFTMEN